MNEVLAGLAEEARQFCSQQLNALRNQSKAIEMAAYMKTTMPFYGVQKPERVPIFRELKQRFKPSSQEDYEAVVLALWNSRYREEKYMAISYAEAFPKFITPASMSLYEQIIREGAWWDFVDPVASNLIGDVYLNNRKELKPIIANWSSDPDFWIRRTTLLVHNKHKAHTDSEQLFALCLLMADEKEFFIRKAIGWSLREYAKTNPRAVADFISKNKEVLSPLSFREASKHLNL